MSGLPAYPGSVVPSIVTGLVIEGRAEETVIHLTPVPRDIEIDCVRLAGVDLRDGVAKRDPGVCCRRVGR